MPLKSIQITLLFLINAITFLCSSCSTSASISFFAFLALSLIPFLKEKRPSLLGAFGIGFTYIIPPEAILFEDELNVLWGSENVLIGYRILVLSYSAFYLGFLCIKNSAIHLHRRLRIPSATFPKTPATKSIIRPSTTIGMLFGTYALLAMFFPMVIYGLTTGRGSDSLFSEDLGGGLLFSVGPFGFFLMGSIYAVSAFWGYYSYQKSSKFRILKTFVFCIPLLLICFSAGSRQYLILALAGAFIPLFQELNLKKICILALLGFSILTISNFMKDFRYGGVFSGLQSEVSSFAPKNAPQKLITSLAEKGSPEGALRNMAMINLYCKTHEYTHGKSIGFMAIFWIPRAFWNDKPTQLDHWLIREYENVSPGYSTASSFCGELFMDFGYACVFACFLLGNIWGRLNRRLTLIGTESYFGFAATGIMFGATVFMVRSIVTAGILLVPASICIFCISKYLLKENSPWRIQSTPNRL